MSGTKYIEIRRLRAADAKEYRAVFVEALIVHPDCFPEDYNEELARPISELEQELERSGTFGAWSGKVLTGIGAGSSCTSSKRRHCGRVRDLYVREQFRHKGIAGKLLEEIFQYAAPTVERLEAEVPSQCESVVKLFENRGFQMCGLSPNGLRVGKDEIDVWTMVRMLR